MAKKHHNWQLPELLEKYAAAEMLEFHRYSDFHMRLMDPGFTVLDCWTTEKYWIKETNYCRQTTEPMIERNGENGLLPSKKKELYDFLDELFYAAS